MLETLSKTPCPEDIAFAKKMVVSKRNRYKDRFPCELYIINDPFVLVYILLMSLLMMCWCGCNI